MKLNNEARVLEHRDVEELKLFIRERVEERPGPLATPCWVWLAALDRDGYAVTTLKPVFNVRVGRLAVRVWGGELPPGKQADHLCRVRACVRYDHFRPATPRQNTLAGTSFAALNAQKTRCLRGHPLRGANLKINGGSRVCRACERRHQKRYSKKRQAQRKAPA